MGHFVYILSCADGSYYTGYTTEVEQRLLTHNAGKGAKYTRGRLPVKLVYSEEFSDKASALRREWEIKHKYTRKEKEKLIES